MLGTLLNALNASTSAVTAAAWDIDGAAAGAILYSGLLSSFFAYAAMAYVNARMGPVTVMAFYPLQSVVTPVLSAIFLGSRVLAADIGGGAAIVAGLALCMWAKVAEGSAPQNSLVAMDADTAEAVTLVLSPKDLVALDEALGAVGGGGTGGEEGGEGGEEGEEEEEEEEESGAASAAARAAAGAALPAMHHQQQRRAPAVSVAGGGRPRRAKTLAAIVAPILHRSLSRSSLAYSPRALAAPGVAGEALALLGGLSTSAPPGGLTRSASVLSGVRRRAATRGRDVVVGLF